MTISSHNKISESVIRSELSQLLLLFWYVSVTFTAGWEYPHLRVKPELWDCSADSNLKPHHTYTQEKHLPPKTVTA